MDLDNKLRNKADQADIIQSVIDRLIASVDEFTDQSCFICDQPIPDSLPGGRLGCTVSLGGSKFPHEFFGGSGTETLTDDGSIIVTPITVTKVDRTNRWTRRILGRPSVHNVPGIIYFKGAILTSLLSETWEPSKATDTEGVEVPLLRDMLSVVRCDAPHDVMIGETMATAMQIHFSTVFDWDLS